MRVTAFHVAATMLVAVPWACSGSVQGSPGSGHAGDASDESSAADANQEANDPRCPAQFDSTMGGEPCSPAGLSCGYEAQSGNALWCTLRDGGPSIWTCGY